jgi:membrane protease YdiL (CAAX protease family)
MSDELSQSRSFPVQAAVFEAGTVFLAVCLGWLISQPPLQTFDPQPHAFMVGVLATLPPLGLLFLCVWVPWRPFRDVLRVNDELLRPMFLQCNLIELAVIAILAGLGEEMLFRGVLQAVLAEAAQKTIDGGPMTTQIGNWLAAVLVAVFFGLMHAVNRSYAVAVGLVGLYLGWLWMYTGNLAVPITAHALYDFLALIYVVRIRHPSP